MTQWILASNGHPFRDRDAAQIKRDLLVSELGTAVRLDVILHPSGGFAVSVSQPEILPPEALNETSPSIAPRPHSETNAALSPREALLRVIEQGEATDSAHLQSQLSAKAGIPDPPRASCMERALLDPLSASERYPDAFRLSPAARGFIGLHLQTLLGVGLLFQPHWVSHAAGLTLPRNPSASSLVLALIGGCGALLAVIGLLRFLWAYTANTYVIDRTGVEQVQWYFDKGRLRRRAPRVNFAHLRSVDVDQSVLQMLVNVGSLKLAAGGTDGYEVVLQHVASPRALQREFQQRLQRMAGSAQSTRVPSDL